MSLIKSLYSAGLVHKVGLGTKGLIKSGSPFPTEYKAIYDQYTTKPNSLEANAWSAFVKTLVDSGDWNELDLLLIFASHINNDSEALIDWINPEGDKASLINSPTFTKNEGFTGNGSNAYINTNYNPSVDGVKYSQNSASLGIYCRTNVQESIFDFGLSASSKTYGQLRNASGNYLFRINDSSNLSGVNSDSRGMYILKRTGATAREAYKNKVSLGSDSASSSGVANLDFYVLSLNNNGSPTGYSTKQIAMFFAGSANINVDTITDAFETAMDALGKGLAP